MRIDQKLLDAALRTVGEIDAWYRLKFIASDDPQRSVDRLREVCAEHLGLDIELLELQGFDHVSSAIWGMFVLYAPKKAHILIASGLNFCHQRMVICKELFHAVLDGAGQYRNPDFEGHVKATTLALSDTISSIPTPSVQFEVIVEIAAMEFLFPYKERAQLIAQGGTSLDTDALAQRYKIPKVMLERYLSDGWMELLKPRQHSN